MGFRICWLAFHGIDHAECLKQLGMTDTGRFDDANDEPFSFASLPGNWHVLFANDFEYMKDKRLAALSKDCEVVGVRVADNVMYSQAVRFKRGVQVWAATHESWRGLRHLDTSGDLPTEITEIRANLLAQLEANGGDKSDVDYVFDAPVELAELITGYRHDRWKFDWGQPKFTEVIPLPGRVPTPWWRKLLGA